MPPEEDIFHDITDASGFQPSAELPWTWIIIGIVVLCTILLIAALLIRHFANKPQEESTDHVATALEKLTSLQEASANQTVQQSASDLSTLLRGTLTTVADTPSVYQSQQEFHQTSDFKLKSAKLTEAFAQHLDDLWQLEYTPPAHDPSVMHDHYATAKSLLERLSKTRP